MGNQMAAYLRTVSIKTATPEQRREAKYQAAINPPARYVALDALRSPCAVDTETTGLHVWQGDRPFAVSFCDFEGRKSFIRGAVEPHTREVFFDLDDLRQLRKFFINDTIVKIFFNAKFDVRMLAATGIETRGRIEEVFFAAHMANNLEPRHDLKTLAYKYCDISDADEKVLADATKRARGWARFENRRLAKENKPPKWKLSSDKDEAIKADYWLAPLELLETYAVLDAERTMLLWCMYNGTPTGRPVYPDHMHPGVLDEENVRHSYDREMKLWPITYGMEERGAKIEPKVVEQEIKTHEAACVQQLATMHKWKPDINPKSPKQVIRFLYGPKAEGNLELPEQTKRDKKTRERKVTADAKARNRLKHPFVDALTKYTAHDKALDFFENYKALMIPDPLFKGQTVALHPDLRQVGPRTGRFSCRKPNLQNVASPESSRSSEPINARLAFGPRPGYVWVHFDYSQLEMRIFADVSQEATLLRAIATGRDMHDECANKAWGRKGNVTALNNAVRSLGLNGGATSAEAKVAACVKQLCAEFRVPYLPPETRYEDALALRMADRWLSKFAYEIVPAEKSVGKKNTRVRAKSLNFLKVFGGGVPAAAEWMECSEDDARVFMDEYDNEFPDVANYIQSMSDDAERDGFIINRFGRKLRIDPDRPYTAVNYMVQGSAADLLKDRMIALDVYIKRLRDSGKVDVWMVLCVHDEIVLEVRKEHAFKWLFRSVKHLMEDHGKRFGVPTEVDVSCAPDNWNDKKPVDLS